MKNIKKIIPYLILFILFLMLMFFSPIIGDNFKNNIIDSKDFYNLIINAIASTNSESLVISKILINLLTCNKIVFNVLNSLCLVSIIYYITKLVRPFNKKLVFFLSLFAILLMNNYTFLQVVAWVSGNITYLFVIPLLLYYFYKVIYLKDEKKLSIILLSFLNFIIPMFSLQTAVILIVFNIFINIHSILKYKKLSKKHIIYLFISLISLISMFIIDSSLANMFIGLDNLKMLKRVVCNVSNFIYYTFIINPYMVILMVISNYYLIKNTIKNKYLKTISNIYFIIFPVAITIFYLISNYFDISIFSVFIKNNMLITLYFISYIIFDIFLIFLPFDGERINIRLLFYILGILSNFIMLLSPTWGYRTSLLTYLLLTISFIMTIDYFYKDKKLVNILLPLISILGFSIYFYI